MKKILLIVLASIMVLGFAASAFAIHAEIPSETQAVVAKGSTQITLGGEIRVRGWWKDNIATFDGVLHWYDWNPVTSTYDFDANRYLYDFTATMPWTNSITSYHLDIANGGSPATNGTILYEGLTVANENKANDHSYYDQRVRLSIDAQVSPNVQGYVQFETNSGRSDTYVWGTGDFGAKAWEMDILQAWILYTGEGLFGVPAGVKAGHMPLALSENQFFDHRKFGDDALVFFVNPNKQLHLGLLTIKGVEGSNTDNTDDIDVYVALATYKMDAITLGGNYTYINSPDLGLKFQNVGLHSNGKVSGLSYNTELDIQFGAIMDDINGVDNSKFRGWGFMAGLGYNLDPVNLRGQFAIGSGDADPADNKIKEFQTALSHDVHNAFVYEYMIGSSAKNQIISGATNAINSATGTGTGIANTTVYNLGVDFKATSDLKLSLDAFLLRATKTGAGISKSLGWEIDAKATYQVAKNLTYGVTAGYFHPGKYYSPSNYMTAAAIDVLDVKKRAVPALLHALTLSF